MKNIHRSFWLLLLVTTGSAFVSSFTKPSGLLLYFPYQQAGLSQRQAAAHLLSRFSYGATPGQVDAVVKQGLEAWFNEQLHAALPDIQVDEKLAPYESLRMRNAEIVQTYPKGGQVLKMAIKDGVVDKDSAKTDKKESKKAIRDYMQERGLKPQAELIRQLVAQKILRAAYANNQLQEVLTDFWFNHFNVAVSKGGVAQFVTAYERDVIRPNALGNFETLLLATAKSPAMLTYLDNNKSTVDAAARMGFQKRWAAKKEVLADSLMQRNGNGKLKGSKLQGLNENYAREIMELHTLGVDGGYTQQDVTEAARVLTGWSLNPLMEYGLKPRHALDTGRLKGTGIVVDGDFLFAALKHDRGVKKVLGQTFAAGGGYEEGVQLIHLLASHPATARFIAKKIAVRFVSDNPPPALVEKMAATFSETHGAIKEVLVTMVSAPEFWAKETLREKTKSPLEVALSAVRSTGAEITAPYPLYQWITKMGQQLYNYQAPTGFPDRGQYWINTGSLLNRMNFGLAVAAGRIPGITLNLPALNQNQEPESAEAALQTYFKLLLPERNVAEAVKQLTPMLHTPELRKKVTEAAGKTAPQESMAEEDTGSTTGNEHGHLKKLEGPDTMLAQVVGIIIGSPEFQRR